MTVLDDSLNPTKPGEIGYIAIPADDPGLFLTYYKSPDQWRQSMRARWFIPGDLFIRDVDGYFWFAGRADDVLKSRGYSISPLEIEMVLREHPSVSEVSVVGVQDERLGRAIRAVIVPRAGHTPSEALTQELRDHVRQKLAPHKVPQQVEYQTELPRIGPIGKVARRVLEQQAQSQAD